jgi:hypothetical protein
MTVAVVQRTDGAVETGLESMGLDGIRFSLPHAVMGAHHDRRWGEWSLPHASWYLLLVAARD